MADVKEIDTKQSDTMRSDTERPVTEQSDTDQSDAKKEEDKMKISGEKFGESTDENLENTVVAMIIGRILVYGGREFGVSEVTFLDRTPAEELRRDFPLPQPTVFRCSLFAAALCLEWFRDTRPPFTHLCLIVKNRLVADALCTTEPHHWSQTTKWPSPMKRNKLLVGRCRTLLEGAALKNRVFVLFQNPEDGEAEQFVVNCDKDTVVEDIEKSRIPSSSQEMEARLMKMRNAKILVSQLARMKARPSGRTGAIGRKCNRETKKAAKIARERMKESLQLDMQETKDDALSASESKPMGIPKGCLMGSPNSGADVSILLPKDDMVSSAGVTGTPNAIA